jgi:hypothetical protein
MGWWQIYPVSSQKGDMVNGDTPADIMGVAVDKIIKVYEKEWDRKPYRAELEAVLNFVTLPDMVEPETNSRPRNAGFPETQICGANCDCDQCQSEQEQTVVR